MTQAQVADWLRGMEDYRRLLRQTEQAMQLLTPEERVVLQRLVVCPDKRSVDDLCELLEVEKSTLYRIRRRALEKLRRCLVVNKC